jgi:transcriptional regulator with XRE-family HTH domain
MQPSELRELRRKLKLTQREAARIFGVTHETFNRFERGARPIPGYVITGVIAMNASVKARKAVVTYWEDQQRG